MKGSAIAYYLSVIARVDDLQTIIHGSSSCSNDEEGIPVRICYSCTNLRTAHFGHYKFAPDDKTQRYFWVCSWILWPGIRCLIRLHGTSSLLSRVNKIKKIYIDQTQSFCQIQKTVHSLESVFSMTPSFRDMDIYHPCL